MERLLLRGFLHHYRDRLWCVIIASLLLNVLVFAGSAYSMIVYDSIIPSGSISTLVALFGILVVVYLFQYTFETLRSEAMLGVANGIHRDLSGRIQHALSRDHIDNREAACLDGAQHLPGIGAVLHIGDGQRARVG